METKELIAKIEALKTFAAEMQANYETRIALLRAKWLNDLPVAQFVELCDTYPHDPVPASKYPSTWLVIGEMQLGISCEAVEVPKVAPVDHVEVLRDMLTRTSAAA